MLSKVPIAKRLHRFELLTGIEYLQAKDVADLWCKILKDISEEKFNEVCDRIEKNKLKWHILPTITDFFIEFQPKTRIPS